MEDKDLSIVYFASLPVVCKSHILNDISIFDEAVGVQNHFRTSTIPTYNIVTWMNTPLALYEL